MTRHDSGLATLYDRVLGRVGPSSWYEPTVSYNELVKGGRLLSAYPPGCWRALGIDAREMSRIQPLVLYFAALVYKGDLLYEEAQRRGSCDVPADLCKKELERLLRGHSLYDEKIGQGLDDLERYGVVESRIVLRQVELTPDLVRAACRLRSSDVVVLIRMLGKLAGVDCDGLLTLLRPWLVLWEVDDDLTSYAEDVAAGTFNVLDLYVRMHGPELAATRLRDFQDSLLVELFDAIDRADRDDVHRLSVLTSERLASRPALAHLLGYLPRPVLAPLAKRLQLWEEKSCPTIPDVRFGGGRAERH